MFYKLRKSKILNCGYIGDYFFKGTNELQNQKIFNSKNLWNLYQAKFVKRTLPARSTFQNIHENLFNFPVKISAEAIFVFEIWVSSGTKNTVFDIKVAKSFWNSSPISCSRFFFCILWGSNYQKIMVLVVAPSKNFSSFLMLIKHIFW